MISVLLAPDNTESDGKEKEGVTRQESGSTASLGSHSGSSTPRQAGAEGFLSPFHGGGALKKKAVCTVSSSRCVFVLMCMIWLMEWNLVRKQ